jgi:hypothetical protein
MAEHMVEFCTHLARAVRDGIKTLTWKPFSQADMEAYRSGAQPTSPFGIVNDTLWVREPWALDADNHVHFLGELAAPGFRAALTPIGGLKGQLTPLPRERAELFLRVTELQIAPLHSVTEESAQAAGMLPTGGRTHREEFEHQWRTIYRGPQAWDANPICWRVGNAEWLQIDANDDAFSRAELLLSSQALDGEWVIELSNEHTLIR